MRRRGVLCDGRILVCGGGGGGVWVGDDALLRGVCCGLARRLGVGHLFLFCCWVGFVSSSVRCDWRVERVGIDDG